MKRIKNSDLIWLIRSCGRATGIPNAGFGGLGYYFGTLICQNFGGRIIAENIYIDWEQAGIFGEKGNYGLPTTSAEFELPTNQFPNLLSSAFEIP
ncbi:MAG: hypothetical protein FWD78_06415 [Treponema sp.]|nr:hypothetical protein [Treponema sp.]